MNHVSAHARVFDGVRTARIRAFDESLLPPHLTRQICGQDDLPAVALWVHAEGHTTALCATHLKASLEAYREEKETAPPAVVPIRRRRNSA